jgi:hypothetical protein
MCSLRFRTQIQIPTCLDFLGVVYRFVVSWKGLSDAYTFLPATMSNPSKDTVQGKPKLGDKLKDKFDKFKARLSPAPSPQPPRTPTPDPSAQRESFKTSGEAGVGKRLRLDCRQGLMN